MKTCYLPHNLFKVLLLVVCDAIIQFEVIFCCTWLTANTLSVRDVSFIRLQSISLNAGYMNTQHFQPKEKIIGFRRMLRKDLKFHAN